MILLVFRVFGSSTRALQLMERDALTLLFISLSPSFLSHYGSFPPSFMGHRSRNSTSLVFQHANTPEAIASEHIETPLLGHTEALSLLLAH